MEKVARRYPWVEERQPCGDPIDVEPINFDTDLTGVRLIRVASYPKCLVTWQPLDRDLPSPAESKVVSYAGNLKFFAEPTQWVPETRSYLILAERRSPLRLGHRFHFQRRKYEVVECEARWLNDRQQWWIVTVSRNFY